MPRLHFGVRCLLAVACLSCVAGVAEAQSTSEVRATEAQAHVDLATRHFQLGRFDAALDELKAQDR